MENSKLKKFYYTLLPVSFGTFIIILLQTQAIHKLLNLSLKQLPLPSNIMSELVHNYSKILQDCVVTTSSVIIGLIFGSFIGFLLASLITEIPKVFHGSLTLMVALNSTPIIALAPIMNRWFPTSFGSKTAVVTIACMGAMSVCAYSGLNSLPKFSLDLMKSYAATKSEVYFKLRVPNSIPYIFVGLRVNVATAMIAGIISEFFATQTEGVGFMIKNSLKFGNQKALGWAYIIAASIVSIIIYELVLFVEKHVLKSHV